MIAVFTVYFEGPFWVGVLESEEDGSLVVARHVFGPEPGNAELLDFMLNRFHALRRSEAPDAGAAQAAARRTRAKRALREAGRELLRPPSTKAQAALSAALEASKGERALRTRADAREEDERRFRLRAAKRSKRRRGH